MYLTINRDIMSVNISIKYYENKTEFKYNFILKFYSLTLVTYFI